MRDVSPRIAALIALVGDKAVADHDEQPPLGGPRKKPTGQVAQGRAESGVAAGGQTESAWRHESPILEVLETVHFDAVSGVAGEYEDSVAFPRERHRFRQRIGAGQFQLEDPSAVHTQ